MVPPSNEVTQLLAEIGHGRRDAWERLTPLVYEELRRLAEIELRHERSEHTLQPTALVHEAYLRLVDQREAGWNNRAHFFGAAATAMRRILIDHARGRRAAKRGGERSRQDLDEALVMFEERSTDLLDLEAALSRLKTLDAEQERIVELRFFGGLSVDETAAVLETSASTVERGWRMARAWLLREISREPPRVS
jgi:RNA polymerase sigma factor (TIGR02999 family)